MNYQVDRASFKKLTDEIKAVGNGRFDWDRKVWIFPKHPDVAVRLRETVEGWSGVVFDQEFLALSQSVNQTTHDDADADDRPPPLVKMPSWKHQARGYRMIERLLGTMLAHDMGTGKTKTTIDAIVNLDMRRVLIACPKSVLAVWPHEFAKHAAKAVKVVVLEGAVKKRMKQMVKAIQSTDLAIVIVTNYASFINSEFEKMCKQPWDLIVLDESHKVKSVRGKTSMALWRLAKHAQRRLCLTGTPMPHSPLDIFAQYRFLDESVFGRYVGRFKAEYAITGGFEGKQILGWRNIAEMNRKIYSIGDRVMKRDVLDLPPVVHEQRLVELGPDARRIYRELENELVADVKEGVVTAANGLVKLLRLQQVTSGFSCVETNSWDEKKIIAVDNAKRHELGEIMEDIGNDEPIVVFCKFRHDLQTVQDVGMQDGRGVYELSGRANSLASWQQSTGGDVLAVQIQAGGVGIDLTRAAYAVYYSIGYSMGDYDQSLARLDRPGQTRSVTYLHLVAKGTIDVAVYAALRAKAKVVESVLGTLEDKS